MIKLLLILFVLLSSNANACSDFNLKWKTKDWIEGSDAIYHGIVVSISLSEKSIYNDETDPLFNVLALQGKKNITFKVFETLKGSPQQIVKTVLPECVGGVTEFGDTGVLFKVGRVWHIKPNVGNWENPISGEIINKLSTRQHKLDLKP